MSTPIISLSAAAILDFPGSQLVELNTTTAGFTVTLPDATKCAGAEITLTKTSSDTNIAMVAPVSGQTIGGGSGSWQVGSRTTPLRLESDGSTDWRVTSSQAIRYGLPSGMHTIPGNRVLSVTTSALGANFDVFYPWFVENTPIVLSGISLEVTTAVAGTTIYLGIATCDQNWNPLANGLIVSAGSVSAAATGVVTSTTGFPVTLQPGRYLAMANISAAGVSLRTYICALPNAPLVSGLGASPLLNLMSASRTAAAFPTSPQAPNTFAGTATGYQHQIVANITTP